MLFIEYQLLHCQNIFILSHFIFTIFDTNLQMSLSPETNSLYILANNVESLLRNFISQSLNLCTLKYFQNF
jgi:hypothetical protein